MASAAWSEAAWNDAAWDTIRLVVFDVDGTLYRQRPLRLHMARDMALATLTGRSLLPIRIIHHYRRMREALADAGTVGFQPILDDRTAAAAHVTPAMVRDAVRLWIEERPLRYLRACRYPGADTLFQGLRQSGRTVAVLSDYPAEAKLAALGLAADPVVWSGDTEVGVLKPNPLGLQTVMNRAGATPETTLMIGDRPERDGEAARRAGVRVLIRSTQPQAGWDCFASYGDAVFRRYQDRVGTS